MSTAACHPATSDSSTPTQNNTGQNSTGQSGGPARVTDLDRITRWQDLGGTWRVLARYGDRVTVSLCRCDVGEEMERMTSTDPDVLAYLGDRDASDE